MGSAAQNLRALFLTTVTALVMMTSSALASCASPAGNPGDIGYSSTQNIMTYCNGTNWISMGVSNPVSFGTLTNGDFCTATSGTAITCTTAGINLTSQVTGVLPATNGGTGVNNGASTITLGGNLTTSGAFPLTFTTTGATSVTLPTTGTLVNTAVTTLSSLASIGTITTGIWNGTIIGPIYGGTGLSSYNKGDILYGSASNVLSALPIGTSGYILTASAGGLPVWSAAPATGVTSFAGGSTGLTPATATSGAVTLAGTLGVANGGTGVTSLTAHTIMLGEGTGTVGAAGVGATGTVLIGNSGADPSFSASPSVTNLTLSGVETLTFGADYSATGAQNNVNLTAVSSVRYTGSGTATFTGIIAGAANVGGEILTLHNASSSALTLANQSASSTATNEIITGTGSDLVMAANSSVVMQYDGGASRWRVIGGSGGGIPAGSTGMVQFNTAGAFNANTNLFWDNTNVRLGIGTAAPQNLLDVNGAASIGYNVAAPTNGLIVNGNVGIGTTVPAALLNLSSNTSANGLFIDTYATGANSAVVLRGAEGTAASPTATLSGDFIGSVSGRGYGATGFSASGKATIGFVATQNWTDSNQGSAITFLTTPNNSTTRSEIMRVDQSGNVGIGTTSPLYKLDIDAANSQIHIGTSGADSGGYIASVIPSNIAVSGGATFNGSNWVAKDTTAGLMVTAAGTTTFYNDTGLTVASTYTPTPHMAITPVGVAIGTSYASSTPPSNGLLVQGNVGIGTTSPSNTLQVQGSTWLTTGTTSGAAQTDLKLGNFASPNQTIEDYDLITNDSANSLTIYGGRFNDHYYFQRGPSNNNIASIDGNYMSAGTFSLYTDAGSATVLLNAGGNSYFDGGNVGIGTTSPTDFLNIYGALGGSGLTLKSTSGAGVVLNRAAAANSSDINFETAGTTDFYIGTGIYSSNSNLNIGNSSSIFVTVGSSGNVGIGSASPQTQLDVLSSTSGSYIIQATNSASRAGGININLPNDSTTGDAFASFRDASGLIGAIGINGIGVAYNNLSDRRVKENIVTTTNGLSTLMRVSVNDFSFIADPNKRRIQGFIAQDLYKVYPEAVTTNGDDGTKPLIKGATPWAVDYGRLTPLIIKAVQELKSLFDSDHDALAKLEADNDNLRAANDNEAAQIKTLTARLDALEAARR